VKNLIPILLLSLLSACAGIGPKICKPGGTTMDFEKDKYECEMKTRTGHPAMLLIDMEQQQKCMRLEKGWDSCEK